MWSQALVVLFGFMPCITYLVGLLQVGNTLWCAVYPGLGQGYDNCTCSDLSSTYSSAASGTPRQCSAQRHQTSPEHQLISTCPLTTCYWNADLAHAPASRESPECQDWTCNNQDWIPCLLRAGQMQGRKMDLRKLIFWKRVGKYHYSCASLTETQ